MMKKVIFTISMSMLCLDIMAQPTPGVNPTSQVDQGIRRDAAHGGAPIAPATLLLLSLGGAAVGTMVYRNTKKD
ncbi:MAG: hypothetical protein UIG52_07190 [Bacteroidales bacterium]|nr:hypothetical protein [Bacteroidales bacterium]